MMYLIGLDADIALSVVLPLLFSIVLLMGIAAFGIAWGGRRVGMLIGVLGVSVGLYGCGVLLFTAPQLCWISVIPVGIGGATLRAWFHHAGAATARWLRFDLRGLLALILFIGLVLGGTISQYRQMQIEEDVAARIQSLPGGSGNNFVKWHFGRVHGAYFLVPLNPAHFDQVADALERLSQLHELQVNGANLPSRVTQRIGHLASLRSLSVQHMSVSDDDLRSLKRLKNLEHLELEADQITDAGLVHLRNLQRLRLLNLYNANQITSTAMANLRAGLPRLDNP